MGLFDYVEGAFRCPKCGHIQKEWQTKNHDCIMDKLDFRYCDYFYSPCSECGTWLDVYLNDKACEKMHNLRTEFTADDFFVDAREDEDE